MSISRKDYSVHGFNVEVYSMLAVVVVRNITKLYSPLGMDF